MKEHIVIKNNKRSLLFLLTLSLQSLCAETCNKSQALVQTIIANEEAAVLAGCHGKF